MPRSRTATALSIETSRLSVTTRTPARHETTVRSGDLIELQITDLALEGRGVGRAGGLVVFADGALPGERVRARVTRTRRGFAEAATVAVLSPSSDRVVPPCPHLPDCGGCDLQHLSSAGQAAARTRQVAEVLRRIGGIGEPPVRETLVPSAPWGYRFRMDFDWDTGPSGPYLGLHHRTRPADIVPVQSCLLAGDFTSEMLRWIPAAAGRLRLAAFDPVRRRGLLRRLSIQEARGTREILVSLETGRGDPPALLEFAAALMRRFPRVVGVARWEFGRDGRPAGGSILGGRDHLFEELEGDRFMVPSDAFFQPNPVGAVAVRRHAVAALGIGQGTRLLELYGGVGFFSVAAARAGASVLVVESSTSGCAAGRYNLEANGVTTGRFLRADVAAALDGLLDGGWDAILLDPPRAGLAPAAARSLARAGAPRLVYVSCDPATLARDLRVLTGTDAYRVEDVTPYELFAQTQHVECVAVLRRA
jgi:23S rRNA (uracil1939-C5)-methyltransferase